VELGEGNWQCVVGSKAGFLIFCAFKLRFKIACTRKLSPNEKPMLLLICSVPDTFHFGTDPAPALFVSDLQDAMQQKTFFL
jgi:hypothetical protein